ncbi:inversin-like [Stegodyphus dumicola]|uniref:inversin-like n=1 Tax=Stegodyphus dumicola TaxID=202533 RepID=UPI0015A95559|nr:inversin-like [Stegodyphus dumicola]
MPLEGFNGRKKGIEKRQTISQGLNQHWSGAALLERWGYICTTNGGIPITRPPVPEPEIIQFLAEKSPPYLFYLRDNNGRIPLEIACKFHCPEAVQILLSQGNSVFGKGDRPFLVNALYNTKNYIDAADDYGTPLITALWKSKWDLEGAFYSTASQNDLYRDICMILIDRRCDVNIPNLMGSTALHVAAQSRHEALVRNLLISGSDIDRRDWIHKTPLYYACRNGNQRIVDLLIICGANLRAEDWETHFERWRQMDQINEKNKQLLNYVSHQSKLCLTLENLRNITIRRKIRNIEEDATQLGLPPLLVKRI